MEITENSQTHLIELGLRIRETRKNKSLTQKLFSQIGKVSVQSQKYYEAGTRSPNTEYLYNLMTHGIDICYIVTGKSEETEANSKNIINKNVIAKILETIERWSTEKENKISIHAKADLVSLLYISFSKAEEIDTNVIIGHLDLLNKNSD